MSATLGAACVKSGRSWVALRDFTRRRSVFAAQANHRATGSAIVKRSRFFTTLRDDPVAGGAPKRPIPADLGDAILAAESRLKADGIREWVRSMH
jgi:hypothetical protein